jgi:hypothetical protein
MKWEVILLGGANLRFKIKKYDYLEENIDMVYSSLKYFGRSQTNEAVKNLEVQLKEKNQLSDLYCQFIKDQKDIIKEQQDQIKSLNNRVQMLEKLLFNVKMK